MNIKCDIDSNFKDYIQSTMNYWRQAQITNEAVCYKKTLLFLGFSIELAILMILRDKFEEQIYTETQHTINFQQACNKLSEHEQDLLNVLTDSFWIDKAQSLIYIKELRNILIHRNGTFNTAEINLHVIQALLVLHYLLIEIGYNLILNLNENQLVVDEIIKARCKHQLVEISERLNRNLVLLNKDNYFDIPEISQNSCSTCGLHGTLKPQESIENDEPQAICWVCLATESINVCCECGVGIVENNSHILNEDDPTNVLCEACYDRIFK